MVRVPYLKPAQTLLREEETDLSFADFGDPRRPNTAQSEKSDFKESPNPLMRIGISKAHSTPWAMSGTGKRGDTGAPL